ncbi:MAG: agmatine deiminase family protein [Aquiluna sp.]|nr:agmatine deiminase family protein [Aquiluna sp.]MCF8545246.1 agmatine deiminase family protein [Aquiluna sp.]
MTFRMPAEWEKHSKTILAFPTAGYTLGDTEAEHEAARKTWASVANAASEFEPVTVVLNPGDEKIAKRYLSSAIELIDIPINDAWIRDSGPSFTVSNKGTLGAIDWVFNGWGAQGWASYDKDAKLASTFAAHEGAVISQSKLVNEGGGFHVDGKGNLLLTETVQLGKERNPNWSKAEVEKELHAQLGTKKAIWIKRGLTRDYEEFGTKGHIDIVACFTPDGRVMYHDQRNPNHPDYLVSQEVREVLLRAGMQTLAVEAPETLKDDEGYVDYSYINHYVLNHGVLLCSFDDAKDKETKALMREAYPGREIVLVDARELFARGGGIHCITQQVPEV